ncbi:MAG: hypothetical protein ACRD36_05155, partial [Candidatus Acidiferrum sp.]
MLKVIIDALATYQDDHPRSKIEIYRQNSVSVRVRIIDPDFAGITKPRRHDSVWESLDKISEEVLSDIS